MTQVEHVRNLMLEVVERKKRREREERGEWTPAEVAGVACSADEEFRLEVIRLIEDHGPIAEE